MTAMAIRVPQTFVKAMSIVPINFRYFVSLHHETVAS